MSKSSLIAEIGLEEDEELVNQKSFEKIRSLTSKMDKLMLSYIKENEEKNSKSDETPNLDHKHMLIRNSL